jgi:murein L,D-transpeptidase YcbB/YkuD
LALGLALALSLAGASRAQAPALAPQDRAAILEALDDCAAGGPDRLGALDDAGLEAALIARARIELGQRVRPSAIDETWTIEPPRIDVEAQFAAARREGRLAPWAASLKPQEPRYRRLAEACRRYAVLVAGGGWEPLAGGAVLRLDHVGPEVAPLRLRLAREGFGPATAKEPDVFDEALQAAVVAFQTRRGLEPDGVVGRRTRAELNVPAQTRLQQILMNMERWRWMPRVLPAERLEVDVGGAMLTYFRGGVPALEMRIVVGDPKHQTPMFASRVESVLFNPPWNVPGSIAAKEILPRAAREPGYLARNGFSFVDGRLVQRPGPKNALGVVKFDLPSPFGVYLHDTPGKSAFQRADRALSHGCMRLEKPRELAALLLGRQGGSAETVEAAIATGRTTRTPLQTPVPLYVAYWTARADGDGAVWFSPDVYGWDEKLAAALRGVEQTERAAMSRPPTDCLSSAG